MDGKEEAWPAAEPAPIWRESAARDEAMDVRMMGECLAPCVKNGQEPDLTAKVPRIGGDGFKSCGNGVEQDGINDGLVVEGDLGDFCWHREHDMEIRHRQQIGLTISEPSFACRALALGAMPVAAGVIGDTGMRAVLTGLDMTAKRCCPAELDRGHDAALDAAETAVMGNTIGMTMATKNIRHLQFGVHRYAQAGGTTSSVRRSSGLCVLPIVLVETWV